MAATKRDTSGLFNAELPGPRPRAARLDRVAHLSPTGLMFQTDHYLPEWTEIGVKMRWPRAVGHINRLVDCHGVVVRCARRPVGGGFEVSLSFLDLPKRAAARLAAASVAAPPTRISLAR